MPDNIANNKRIAKNTILLYIRMLFIMGVNLYTSRVVLKVLGAEDYGTYNVVGGVVTMLSFITSSLSGSTSRFITYEIGKGEKGNAEMIFRCCSTIFYLFAIASFVLAETVGLWFVQTKLNIPAERENAAFWVYQFSVVSFIISILSVSYNALVIAKEKMNAYAFISIYDGVARLGILYLLTVVHMDKLILYAGLLTLVQLSVRVIYAFYCKRSFSETNSKWLWNGGVSKKIFSYAGWSMTGYLAIVGYTQGINILLNIYFGPVVNAARSIATQVQTALAQFYANFQTAVKPQLFKSYAQGDYDFMHSLVLRTGRISFLLAILINIPFMAFTEYVLNLWLVNPPDHVVAFVRLTLIAGISNSLSHHTIMAIHATGDIRNFQLIEGACLLTILPISWILLKYFHVSSEIVIAVYVLVEIVTQFVRVYLVYPRIKLSITYFYTKIILPAFLVLFLYSIPAVLLRRFLSPIDFMSFALETILLILFGMIIIYSFGITKSERSFLNDSIIKWIKR